MSKAPTPATSTASEEVAESEPPYLSLVIPAFNEQARLGATIAAAQAYLGAKPWRSEVIVVLDGCTDGTAQVARRYTTVEGPCAVVVLDNPRHRGKGACVRQGMLAARGRFRFFTDADLSYPLAQIDGFLDELETRGGVVIASRESSSVPYDRPLRRVLTFLSRQLMRRVFVPGISDTQAGLKGFTAAVAEDLFALQTIDGFGFDVEILHVAHLRGYRIRPVEVTWRDVPGSRVRVRRDLLNMGLDLGRVARNSLAGRYREKEVR